MATNAAIAIQEESGKIKYIYCHFDGGRHVEEMLKTHYTDRQKVIDLIKLGSISHLDENITKPDGHSYGNQMHGYPVAYHRDRGEKIDINICDTYERFIKNTIDYSYVYLFGFDNIWKKIIY